MPKEQSTNRSPGKTKKRRPFEYLIVVIIIALVVSGAYYQEEVSGFFRLHAWDRGAPGRAVVEFLTAGKKGDRARADTYLGSPLYTPLIKNGAWIGYSTTVQATRVLYTFEDLIPTDSLQPASTQFNMVGDGSADVTVPDRQGHPVIYSLMRRGGRWRIISIRGGKAEQTPSHAEG
jgi:hypothetical protein